MVYPRTCTDCGVPLHACFGSCHAVDFIQAHARLFPECAEDPETKALLFAFGPWNGRVREKCGECHDHGVALTGMLGDLGRFPMGRCLWDTSRGLLLAFPKESCSNDP